MAKLIDTDGETVAETTDIGFDDLVETNPTEEQVAPVEAVEEAPVDQEPVADLPDKYQGKSASDIAKMHQELEKRLGQQSSEVGELRAAFDSLVQKSISAPAPTPEVEEVTDADFFADPLDAVRRAVESHPTLKAAEQATVTMARNSGLAALKADHPDMKEVLMSQDFQKWKDKSQIRQGLYDQADRYDFAAASELLTLYKESHAVKSKVAQVEKVAAKQAVKNASTGTARSAPEGKTKGKIYRRADIMQLLATDPKRYDAMADEIYRAYAEGRVKK